MKIESATTDEAILACLPVLKQLRPTIAPESFVVTVRRMEVDGYRLVALRDPEVVAVAGYRVIEMFATGRILYIDDLVTDEAARSGGRGRAVLKWLAAEGERLGCVYLELDSGSKRLDAHRFYRREGLEEVALHFSRPLGGATAWTSG
jgi:GNAT superfamily N-acetyltransferase